MLWMRRWAAASQESGATNTIRQCPAHPCGTLELMAANLLPAVVPVADVAQQRGVRECLQWFTREKQWINEIHNWGLGMHSEQFVLDVKGILVREEGGLKRVSMTKRDMVEWGLEVANSDGPRSTISCTRREGGETATTRSHGT